ncbi:MAG: hypothetical protein RI928_178 [Pseudomonadota bacterium]
MQANASVSRPTHEEPNRGKVTLRGKTRLARNINKP